MRLESVCIDVLRAVDLGVTSHVIGNVLLEVMSSGVWGGNRSTQLQTLEGILKTWYSKNKTACRIQGHLTAARFKSANDWPKFKGKAASNRHIVPFIVEVAQEHNSGSMHDRRRLAVCQLLHRYYTIIAEEPRFMSQAAQREISLLCNQLLNIYKCLSREALDDSRRGWKLSPKFHLFQHSCETQCKWMNPRFTWAYADEDLQGLIKPIAVSCHPFTMADVTCKKWLRATF
eukprot:7829102-Pyramimonas_sp.AAC.1